MLSPLRLFLINYLIMAFFPFCHQPICAFLQGFCPPLNVMPRRFMDLSRPSSVHFSHGLACRCHVSPSFFFALKKSQFHWCLIFYFRGRCFLRPSRPFSFLSPPQLVPISVSGSFCKVAWAGPFFFPPQARVWHIPPGCVRSLAPPFHFLWEVDYFFLFSSLLTEDRSCAFFFFASRIVLMLLSPSLWSPSPLFRTAPPARAFGTGSRLFSFFPFLRRAITI